VIALLVVRAGELPAGGDEAVAESGGRVILVGEGARSAADGLVGLAREVFAWETRGFAPAAWAARLKAEPVVADEPVIVLPASPDGRDLAPRLAHVLHRPLLAGAIEIRHDRISLARWGGLVIEDVVPPERFVVTLQPGVRGVEPEDLGEPVVRLLEPAGSPDGEAASASDAQVVGVLPPDAATIDLGEALRILAGGAGLDGPARFEQLAAVASALDASMGATRVVTDRGWVGHERQIGTTGAVVDPQLYVAFAISGAVQHTSGLGQPDHIVSVNVDAHCPMMQMADLAIVSDANAVLDVVAARLGLASVAEGRVDANREEPTRA
jgi:electron transfer flavoprotein alpha subunit